MRKRGKRTIHWDNCRSKLKQEYYERNITRYEINFPGCWRNNGLGFCHRHKRKWYLDKPELLGDINQTILSCNDCHDKIEDDADLTERIFNRLRPLDEGERHPDHLQ